MFEIRRLPTRDIRENLMNSRKKAWSFKLGRYEGVILSFSRDYIQLYLNYLQGLKKINLSGNHKKYMHNKLFRFIITSYIPSNSSSDLHTSYSIISNFLTKLNRANQKKLTPSFRYVHMAIDLVENEATSFKNKQILQTLHKIVKLQKDFRVGPGIEDPVLSNFILNDSGCHLIDLDNYSGKVSLNYQLGYLAKDIELDFDKSFHVNLPNNNENKIMFFIGSISRLINLVLNVKNNKNRDYGYSDKETVKLLLRECELLDSLLK